MYVDFIARYEQAMTNKNGVSWESFSFETEKEGSNNVFCATMHCKQCAVKLNTLGVATGQHPKSSPTRWWHSNTCGFSVYTNGCESTLAVERITPTVLKLHQRIEHRWQLLMQSCGNTEGVKLNTPVLAVYWYTTSMVCFMPLLDQCDKQHSVSESSWEKDYTLLLFCNPRWQKVTLHKCIFIVKQTEWCTTSLPARRK